MDHSADAAANQQSEHMERRYSILMFVVAAILVVGNILAFVLWGSLAITIIGLASTVAVFALLIAYATGL